MKFACQVKRLRLCDEHFRSSISSENDTEREEEGNLVSFDSFPPPAHRLFTLTMNDIERINRQCFLLVKKHLCKIHDLIVLRRVENNCRDNQRTESHSNYKLLLSLVFDVIYASFQID